MEKYDENNLQYEGTIIYEDDEYTTDDFVNGYFLAISYFAAIRMGYAGCEDLFASAFLDFAKAKRLGTPTEDIEKIMEEKTAKLEAKEHERATE